MLWLDTYFEWIAPSSQCCGKDEDDNFCLYPQYNNDTCRACLETQDENGWPYPDDFEKYLRWFLKDNPGVRCPSGGHAAFANAVKFYDAPDNETVRSELVLCALSSINGNLHFPSSPPPPLPLSLALSVPFCSLVCDDVPYHHDQLVFLHLWPEVGQKVRPGTL